LRFQHLARFGFRHEHVGGSLSASLVFAAADVSDLPQRDDVLLIDFELRVRIREPEE